MAKIIVVIDDDPVRCAVYQCGFESLEYELAFPRSNEAVQSLTKRGGIEAVLCARPLLTPDFEGFANELRTGALARHPWFVVEEGSDEPEDTTRDDMSELMLGQEGVMIDEQPKHQRVEPPPDLRFPFEIDELRELLRGSDDPAPRVATPTPAASPQWDRFTQQIDALHQALDKMSYYQLLGIDDSAEAGEVQLAYEQRSLELHPDRFLQLSDSGLREKLYTIYKRMVEAFRVLDHPQRRTAYDDHLATRSGSLRLVSTARKKASFKGNPWDVARTSSAKTMLRSAVESLRTGQQRKGLQMFQAALQLEPDNQEIRALYEKAKQSSESSE